MSWTDLTIDNDYQIFTEFPHQIRKKSNGRIVSEYIVGQGYIGCKLNGKSYYKHKIIAIQFIPNPDNLPEIDHVNHNRTDNRIENLRFVSRSTNQKNKTSYGNIEVIYLDDIPDESIVVNDYGIHQFENYYFDEQTDKFYFYNGQQYRELHVNETKIGSKYVIMKSTENKRVNVYYPKFKRLYDLI